MAPAKSRSRIALPESPPVLLRGALFLIGSVLVYALIQWQVDDLELIDITPYFLFALAVQFLPFVVRRKPDLFEPVSLQAILTMVALVPAFISFLVERGISLQLVPHVTGRARIELVQTVLIAYAVASLAYYAGYYLRFGKRLTGAFPDLAGGEWRRSRLITVTLVCMAAFVPAYAFFQSRVGASITDITQLAAGKAVWREDSTMSWLMRGTGLGFIPVLLLVGMYFERLSVPKPVTGVPVLGAIVSLLRHIPPFFTTRKGRGALFAIVAFVVVSFLTTRLGQRGTALYIAFNALIVVHYVWRRIPVSLLLAGAFVAVVGTNFLGNYRSKPEVVRTAQGPTANFNATDALVEHESDRLRIAAMAAVFHYFPERKDYLMGESWAAVAAMFVPRWLWPEKAKMFEWRDTNIITKLIGPNVPISYPALLYANFSWIGIVMGMALLGMFQRGLYEWMLKNQKDKNVVLFYALAVMYLVPTLIQLSSVIGYLVPVYVSIVYIRKKPAQLRASANVKPAAAPALPEPGPTAAE